MHDLDSLNGTEALRLQISQLQALRNLEHEASDFQDDEAIAKIAIQKIRYFVPSCRACAVFLNGIRGDEAEPIAFVDFKHRSEGDSFFECLSKELILDFESLKEVKHFAISNLGDYSICKRLSATGINSLHIFPLEWRGDFIGVILLAFESELDFNPKMEESFQDFIDTLAGEIQKGRSRKAEQGRRREAEFMRDVLVELASAVNLKQTLEIILVNLHNLIHYDRASLVLADEKERYGLSDRGIQDLSSFSNFPENDPIVQEFRRKQKPIIVDDIQADDRFNTWTDMQSVRGWLGAPIYVGEDLIGFLSLGSMRISAYSQSDADLMQSFASEVSEVLEKAWLYEQTQQRTEELEVLSKISFVLGQAESRENTLSAIIYQIGKFIGCDQVTLLLPNDSLTALVVKHSSEEDLIGEHHPLGDDLFWNVFRTGETIIIADIQELTRAASPGIYSKLFYKMHSAVITPLSSGERIFGVLSFTFERRRSFPEEKIRLLKTIAEIAGTSIRRAVILEDLERQVNIRTQHLSTLYNINAVASDPIELGSVLERILVITLEAMNNSIGAIHLLDNTSNELYLVVQKQIPQTGINEFSTLPLASEFWNGLIKMREPIVVPNVSERKDIPEVIRLICELGRTGYIGVPIRSKGILQGLLSIFGRSVLEYSVEDITLFMTIADQIGSSIERGRLIKQAELAAVVEERQRLARELHDSVTQLLYSQILFAGAGLKVIRQGNISLARQHLTRIDQAAFQALKEMRLLVYQLRTSDYLEDGIVSAIERRLDSVERRIGIQAKVSLEGKVLLDETKEIALYRIAEEALNNVLKHATASEITIKITGRNGKVRLEITDNGCGFELDQILRKSVGMGITNMRDRALALDGKFEIITSPDQGTHIIVTI